MYGTAPDVNQGVEIAQNHLQTAFTINHGNRQPLSRKVVFYVSIVRRKLAFACRISPL